jgi:hypothetical protein
MKITILDTILLLGGTTLFGVAGGRHYKCPSLLEEIRRPTLSSGVRGPEAFRQTQRLYTAAKEGDTSLDNKGQCSVQRG